MGGGIQYFKNVFKRISLLFIDTPLVSGGLMKTQYRSPIDRGKCSKSEVGSCDKVAQRAAFWESILSKYLIVLCVG